MTKTYRFNIATADGPRPVLGHITKMTDLDGRVHTFGMHQRLPSKRWVLSDYATGYRVRDCATVSYHQARADLMWEVKENDLIGRILKMQAKCNHPVINTEK